MADLTRFLTYYIVLTDPALVKQYQAQFPYGYQFAPYNPHDASTGLPGGAAVAFAAPWNGRYPAPSGNYTYSPEYVSDYDPSVATFERKTGGFWFFGGTTVRYYWVGQFQLAEPQAPTIAHVVPPAPANIAARHWCEGFELGNLGIAVAGVATGMSITRDAARSVGGLGLAVRGASNVQTAEVRYDNFGLAFPATSWERFYLRVRRMDTFGVPIWESYANESSNYGFRVSLIPNGSGGATFGIEKKIAGVYTLVATGGTVPIWTASDHTKSGFVKVDLFQNWGNTSPGVLRIYCGTDVIQGSAPDGVPGQYHHRGSRLGNSAGVANETDYDLDDWIGCDQPTDVTGKDFLSGSKVVLLRPKAYSGAHDGVHWTGPFQALMQRVLHANQTALTNVPVVTSATASAVMEVTTDDDLVIDAEPNLGVVSVMATVVGSIVGGTDGQLGWTFNGGAPSLAVIDQTAAVQANHRFYSYSGGTTPTDVTPITLRYLKSPDANAAAIYQLAAQVEILGQFGVEDYRTTENSAAGAPSFPSFMGQHNAPYPRDVWATDPHYAPNSPYAIYSNTYVGNGTAQDLLFPAPIHYLYIRPVTGDAGGAKWWSTMVGGAHRAADRNVFPGLVHVDEDPTFVPGLGADLQQKRYRARLAGTDTQFNAVGVTYQYVAISDPGARFLLNLVIAAKSSTATLSDYLINTGFTPEFAFVWPETHDGTAGGQPLLKGPQNAASDLSSFSVAAKVTGLTFAQGLLTSLAALHTLPSAAHGGCLPIMLLRRADGLNDPGQAGVMALLSWVGDGSGSRTISLPLTGKRPIFAIAAGDAAAGGFQRDVSHTGTNSTGPTGTNSTTGITGGGVDSLSVGATLNTNGVNYNAFVLLGDATAGNGGFGVNGTYVPVEAGAPVDGPYTAKPDVSVFTPPVVPATPLVGEPDLEDSVALTDNTTELGGLVGGQHCEYYTRKLVNMALSHIGVSKQIVNLANDTSQEATLARRHVLEDVNTTLRAFPWAFARRYVSLVLVGGTDTTPVNADWQYSYRAPASMMAARRLTNLNHPGRAYDPDPIRFGLGSDDAGSLVFTNEPATTDLPLVLEYTVRQLCPAYYGDTLFRDALTWKFAESLAPVLARDKTLQEYCRARFVDAISAAEVHAANEQQQAPAGDADWIRLRDGIPSTFDPWGRS